MRGSSCQSRPAATSPGAHEVPWSSTQWTEERTERLKKLWQQGFSAGLIAREFRTTRNAVIGKIQRLGLDWRPETQLSLGNRGKRAKPSPQKPAPRPAQLLKTEQQVSSKPFVPFRLRLIDLQPGQCRWPEGDGPFWFCGARQARNSSYCEEHTRRSFSGVPKPTGRPLVLPKVGAGK